MLQRKMVNLYWNGNLKRTNDSSFFIDLNNEQLYIFDVAQVLKEEVKERIIDSTVRELLDKGYEKASLRSIAFKARMTVGNLYNYFKNKEELISFIIDPCIIRLNRSIEDNYARFMQVKDKAEIRDILDNLCDDVISVYLENRKPMIILLEYQPACSFFAEYFSNILIAFKEKENGSSDPEYKTYTKIVAESIFAAFKRAFKLYDQQEYAINKMLKDFLYEILMIALGE